MPMDRPKRHDEKIELQMTPMIDIVFQLLVFFIMTFKIVSQEGDFNIKMPLASAAANEIKDLSLPPIRVRLTADPQGTLNGVYLNDRAIPFILNPPPGQIAMQQLRNEIVGLIGPERGPGTYQEEAEVELDCDYGLHYAHVIEAITAVSGQIDPQTGEVDELVEKIKFAPPRARGG